MDRCGQLTDSSSPDKIIRTTFSFVSRYVPLVCFAVNLIFQKKKKKKKSLGILANTAPTTPRKRMVSKNVRVQNFCDDDSRRR